MIQTPLRNLPKNRPVFIFQAFRVFCSYIINIIIILSTFTLSRLFPDPSCGSLQNLLPLLIDFHSDSCCFVLLIIINIPLPDLCFMLSYLSHWISLLIFCIYCPLLKISYTYRLFIAWSNSFIVQNSSFYIYIAVWKRWNPVIATVSADYALFFDLSGF